MFEDSLVESTGVIRTRSRWTAVISATAQIAAGTFFFLLPLLHPAILRSSPANTILLDPPRPRVTLPRDQMQTPPHRASAVAAYDPMVYHPAKPDTIIHPVAEREPNPGLESLTALSGSGAPSGGAGDGVVGSVIGAVPYVPPAIKPRPAAPAGPMRVSSGVAAGSRIAGAAPVYSQLALATRTSGHVIVEATISRTGAVKDAHVLSGPALLRQAALDAVATYRYRPFQVSGQPVDALFTVDINFTLGQ